MVEDSSGKLLVHRRDKLSNSNEEDQILRCDCKRNAKNEKHHRTKGV